MNSQIDLSQLATPRLDSGPAIARGNRLVWLTRYLLPLLLVAGFLGTLGYSFREAFLPSTSVTVVPVMAVRAEIEQSEAPLFQSAGWVEARPTPVIVSALQEGVVLELLVIEGQELTKGDVVARLIDADAKLHLRDAEAEVRSRNAEVASAKAALTAAEIRLREPIELQTKVAEAEAMLARVENERSRLPSQVKAVQARIELAKKDRQSKQQSAEAVSRLAIARADSELEASEAALTELEAQRNALVKEQAAQLRRVEGLRRQLELKVEEQKQVDETTAAVELAAARSAKADVALDAAKLRLSRMVITAPVDGRVLALVAKPGTKVMGLTPATMPDASTVVTMYDPARLQIRADVRLEEVPRVFTGQRAKIETAAVRGPMEGEVIAATSLTDIQKNTLQVKVAVNNPPAVLKPDMLVQITFLSPVREKPVLTEHSPLTLVIPPSLIERNGENAEVWLADRKLGVARRRSISTGGTTTEGLVEVKAGLAAGDRLIVGGAGVLKDGVRIRIESETDAPSGPQSLPAHSHSQPMKRL